MYNYEEIARIAYEMNKRWCELNGDYSFGPWEEAPEWQKQSLLKGIMFHSANPDAGPEASHESWLAEKERTGWVYGPLKDAEKRTHPCMVPHSKLPPIQRAKDVLFTAVVRAYFEFNKSV